MSESNDARKQYSTAKKLKCTSKEEMLKLDKEELVDFIFRLDAHNEQLHNIIQKNSTTGQKKDNKQKRKFDFTKYKKQHVFFKFLYLGWDYSGFVTQEFTTRTIEHEVFCALTKAYLIEERQTSNYHRCGRTDKGVSAFSQVISLDVRCSDDPNKELPYCTIMNSMLPNEIRMIAWAPVDSEASARFSCNSRTYKYFFPRGQLDIEAMKKAASMLIGEHDFRNLCKMDVVHAVVSFDKKISSAEFVELTRDNEYGMYMLVISASGFLWHQIRCIMEVLLLIGEKKEKPEVIKELLDVKKHPRKPQYNIAHELPLVLYDCKFDFNPDWRYDEMSLSRIVRDLQRMWAINQIKATQVQSMIKDILKIKEAHIDLGQITAVLHGKQPKVHCPLMQRPTCQSLESRIDHYVKKKRIVVSDTKNEEKNDNGTSK